ncbi:hypothetical protein [Streptomyces sp. NPDC058664]|uniref:hypothetical protein n=1 Tax=unclassified Streptomyces TaxID=2593676 RepID=UPI00364BD543
MSEQQLAEIADLIGGAKPARDSVLIELAESVRDRLTHDHATQREDWYCMNLTAFMGERMGPVLRRLLDAEAELTKLRSRVAELEAAVEEGTVDPAAEWRRIEAERPEAGVTHRCGIPLVRRLDCGHCPHEICEDCERCPHTCRCGTPVSIPQQRSEAS